MKRAVIVGVTGLIAALVLGPRATFADVISEVEPNDAIAAPQKLVFDIDGSATVQAVMGTLADVPVSDTDFYEFTIAPGGTPDTVTIEVISLGNADPKDFTPFFALFDQNNNIVIQGDGSQAIGMATATGKDLQKITLGAATYKIGVTFFPRKFIDGGDWVDTVLRGAVRVGMNGDYTLHVSGVTSAGSASNTDSAVPVEMKVRPGERHFVRLNPKSRATLKVAILANDLIDASEISTETETLTFGATGDEVSLKNCREKMKDVNGDGRKDLICRFYISKGGFEVGDQVVVLKGETISGVKFESHGSLKVKYERRKNRHKGKHDRDDDDDHDGKGHGKYGKKGHDD